MALMLKPIPPYNFHYNILDNDNYSISTAIEKL